MTENEAVVVVASSEQTVDVSTTVEKYNTVTKADLALNPHVVEVEERVFAADQTKLSMEDFSGTLPTFYGKQVLTEANTGKRYNITVVSHQCQSLNAIASNHKNTYQELDDAEKVSLLRAALSYYRTQYAETDKKIFKVDSKVQCADMGKYWEGQINSGFIDSSGDVYYRISYTTTKDNSYHICHRVRVQEEETPIPSEVGNDTSKMKMVSALEGPTKGKGSCAGAICFIEGAGGLRPCIIECVDTAKHKVLLHDIGCKILFQRPPWSIHKFGNVLNRKVPQKPEEFATVGSSPFSGPVKDGERQGSPCLNDLPVSRTVKEAIREASTAVQLAKNKKKKAQEGKSETVTEKQKESLNEIVQAAVSGSLDKIMGSLTTYYDNRAGNVLSAIQALTTSTESVAKQGSSTKGAVDKVGQDVTDALKGSSFMKDTLQTAVDGLGTRVDNMSSEFEQRHVGQTGELAKIRVDLKHLTEMVTEIHRSITSAEIVNSSLVQTEVQHGTGAYTQTTQHQLQQPPTTGMGQGICFQSSEGLLNAPLDFSSMAGGLQSSTAPQMPIPEDLRRVGGFSAIMEDLRQYEQPEDSRISLVSNSASTAQATAEGVLQSIGMKKQLQGSKLRRVVSFDRMSTTVEETTFQTPCRENSLYEADYDEVLTEYGVLKSALPSSGTLLLGIQIDQIPQMLEFKLNGELRLISARQKGSGEFVTRTLSNCLRIFFNELKLLVTELPLRLMEKPSYKYNSRSSSGALNDLIAANVEPLRSILSFLKQRLITLDEVLLTRCLREALQDFQKAYYSHINCKHVRPRSVSHSSQEEQSRKQKQKEQEDIDPKPPTRKEPDEPAQKPKPPKAKRNKGDTAPETSLASADDLTEYIDGLSEQQKRRLLESL